MTPDQANLELWRAEPAVRYSTESYLTWLIQAMATYGNRDDWHHVIDEHGSVVSVSSL